MRKNAIMLREILAIYFLVVLSFKSSRTIFSMNSVYVKINLVVQPPNVHCEMCVKSSVSKCICFM
eukprot:TRINITY_DN14471_c0_g1_i1.p1 TRINITY_DN14471_c0_g1~~TRINITY_DN14471_c0_g1_i1.p1  ORF type:complete len:65 (-),score=3.37 TRINITY_DN14471_c0_g1_i1:356-550(-)